MSHMSQQRLHRLVSLVLVAASMMTAQGAQAEDAQAQDEKGPHDGLLFGRLLLGVGYGALEEDDAVDGFSARGLALNWDAAIGLKVTDDLALHASFYGVNAIAAKIKQGDEKINSRTSGMAIASLGPGLTYHIPKVDVYLSFATGLGWTLVAPLNAPDGFGRIGFGAELLVGKDWWIRKGLAVGAGAQAVYVRVSDDAVEYDGFGGGVGINVTHR